jgi:hypothetical protein
MSTKNRTRDLRACSAVSQPTAPPPAPSLFQYDWNTRVHSIQLEFQKVNGIPDSIMSLQAGRSNLADGNTIRVEPKLKMTW